MLIGITTTLVAGWRSCSCADKPKRAQTILERPAANESWRRVLFLSANSRQQTVDSKQQTQRTKY
jgi:hypothetical protein